MRSLKNFLAGLPGIKPHKARATILEGDVLSEGARADLHERDSYWGGVIEVGPDAAAAILAAYRAGRLPMNKGAVPTDAPEAEAYLAKREALIAELVKRDRHRRALKDPSLVVEADLDDHWFLNDLFHAHAKGGSTLTLAGITVTKTLSRYSSNSGKSQGWGVNFEWTASDGTRRNSSSLPPEANNRRNDPERNWGLPPG